MGEFSRRDFIKTACISVGALAASSSGVYALDHSSKMDKDTNLPSCDVLVIGSGGAGLRAAAAVRKENPKLSVVVATKMMPSRNATCMAEGGINGDSYKLHAYDTIKGGAYLVDQDAALKFCELARRAIFNMGFIGTLFSRNG